MPPATIPSHPGPVGASFLSRHGVGVFSVVTAALIFGLALLPLLLTPSLAVLVPTVVAIGLISVNRGPKQVRTELFRAGQWRPSLRWLLVPIGGFLAQSLLLAGLARALGQAVQASVPSLSPLHLAVVIFSALE